MITNSNAILRDMKALLPKYNRLQEDALDDVSTFDDSARPVLHFLGRDGTSKITLIFNMFDGQSLPFTLIVIAGHMASNPGRKDLLSYVVDLCLIRICAFPELYVFEEN